jgi:hypothetical protein
MNIAKKFIPNYEKYPPQYIKEELREGYLKVVMVL